LREKAAQAEEMPRAETAVANVAALKIFVNLKRIGGRPRLSPFCNAGRGAANAALNLIKEKSQKHPATPATKRKTTRKKPNHPPRATDKIYLFGFCCAFKLEWRNKNQTKQETKMKDLQDHQTRDLMPPKNKWGGVRPNSGRPPAPYKTKTLRVDTRLLKLIETLKTRLISGAIDEDELKIFEDLAAN